MSNPKQENASFSFRLRDLIKPSFNLWLIAWLLGLVTVVSIVGLLMVSGWFLTASALAGMVAVGSHTFNYMMPAAVIRMMAISRTAGRYGELMVSHNAIFSLLGTLRLRFFRTLSAQPLTSQYASLQSAQQMHRLVKDINVLDEFNLRVVSPWLMSVLMIGGLTGLILFVFQGANTPLINIAIILLMAMALIIPAVMARIGIAQARSEAKISEQRRQSLLSPLTITTQLLLWKQWQAQTKDFIHNDQALHNLDWQAQKRRSLTMFAIQLVLYAVMLLILLAVVYGESAVTSQVIVNSSINSSIEIPLVLALILGLFGIQEVILPLGQHYQSLGNSLASKQRLNELLHSEKLHGKKSNAEQSNNIESNDTNSKQQIPLPVKADNNGLTMSLSKVSCKLPNAIVGAENVNATITTGRPLMVTGASGCGKSTLLQTLANELPLQAGEIQLNGRPWQDYDWADQLGYLGQQIDIFDQTLADNLRLGKPDATDDELMAVLEKVSLADWANEQPQGLNTRLGEYGTAISGGQARRIALARLLLKPRAVLLLDEPFAGLDNQSRGQIWQTITQHQKDGILIIVSHHHSQQADWQGKKDVDWLELGI